MISNFSGVTVPEGKKEEIIMVNGEKVKSNYIAIVTVCKKYRGAVGNYNTLRKYGKTKYQVCFWIAWGKNWWPIRVFLSS